MSTNPINIDNTSTLANAQLAGRFAARHTPNSWSGLAALVAISLLTLSAFYGLINFSGQGADWQLLSEPYYQSILLFSIKQALLSTLLSLLLAWPVARALYYGRQPFASSFLNLCLLSFVMPTLVLITGLVALLGRDGLLTPLLGNDWNLYGLNGILIAHTCLNMPFAIRVLLQALQHIPDSSWVLAAQLKLTPWQRLRIVELPALKAAFLQLSGFIFVLCFNSFAVVLALGGGPRATTLEVAIYQALKYDFNIPEALTLAWSQLLIAGLLFALIGRAGGSRWLSVDTLRRQFTPKPGPLMRWLHHGLYGLCALALLLPMLALLDGLHQSDLSRFEPIALLQPTLTSLLLAGLAAGLAISLAWLILHPIRMARLQQWRSLPLLDWLATHALVAPAMVISVGLYILLLPRIDLDRYGMLMVLLLNAALVIPYAISQLRPRLLQYDAQYHALSQQLKLTRAQQRATLWPFIRPAFLSCFALMLLLALGDVAIIAIFGNDHWTTLPWLIYGYAGSYRIAEASLASLMLLLICALTVSLFERHRHRD
ncbi:MAG: ABC transporter permease subunit [Marinobacterium sp.]|nr:ABC transporter permease subunit [Marinobacterium sp.]